MENIFKFGKYKGKLYNEVISKDINYCNWLLRQESNSTNNEFKNYYNNEFKNNNKINIPTGMIACSKLCEYYENNIEILNFIKNIDINKYNIISPDLTNDTLKLPPHIYGQFIDYLIRYKISVYLESIFDDSRALTVLRQYNNEKIEITKINESYMRLISKIDNKNYLNDIFNVSLCHSLFFENIKCLDYLDYIKNINFTYNEHNLELFIESLCKYKKKILCNPVLGSTELQISADADLIIDDEIIDFKCSKYLIGEKIKDYIQFFIYLSLYYIKDKIKIKKISIINLQLNIVYYIDLTKWDNYDNFINILRMRNIRN